MIDQQKKLPRRLDLMAALRAARKLPQWWIARQLGCSQARFSMIENGLIEPTEEERVQIATFLHVEPALLFGEVNEEATTK